jgi:hypothetical protein
VSKALFVKEIKEDNDYDMLIIDRQKDGYFSQSFAKCIFTLDSRENTKMFHKLSENFARKVFKDNAHDAEAFRSRLTDTLLNNNKIDIDTIAQDSFSDETMRNEYKAAMLSSGITETNLNIDNEWAAKKLKRKRLKVDNNIELYIDTEIYKDKEKLEIKRNGDGTINIVLKNIKNYIEK